MIDNLLNSPAQEKRETPLRPGAKAPETGRHAAPVRPKPASNVISIFDEMYDGMLKKERAGLQQKNMLACPVVEIEKKPERVPGQGLTHSMSY